MNGDRNENLLIHILSILVKMPRCNWLTLVVHLTLPKPNVSVSFHPIWYVLLPFLILFFIPHLIPLWICQCQGVAVASTCWIWAAVMSNYLEEEEEVAKARRTLHLAQPHCASLYLPLVTWSWRWSMGASTSRTSKGRRERCIECGEK